MIKEQTRAEVNQVKSNEAEILFPNFKEKFDS